jgi:PAS domain S-box-containing protein
VSPQVVNRTVPVNSLPQNHEPLLERASPALVESCAVQNRYRRLVELSPDGFFDWDLSSASTWFSPQVESLLPRPVEGRPRGFARFSELVIPEDRARLLLAIRRHLERRETLDVSCRLADGHTCRLVGVAERDSTGRPQRLIGVLHDVSGTQRVIDELQDTIEQWRGAFDSLPAAVAVLNARGELIEINQAWRDAPSEHGLIGLRYGFGENYLDLLEKAAGRCNAAPAVSRGLARVQRGATEQFVMDYPAMVGDRPHLYRVQARAVRQGAGHGMVVSHVDLTASGLATADAAAMSQVFEQMLDAVPSQIAYVDRDGVLRHVNEAYERWAGVPAKGMVGHRLADLVSAANWQDIAARVQQALAGTTVEFAARIDGDAGDRELIVSYVPQRDAAGEVQGFTSITRDVTAERQLESEMRQVQKMEAIGQLTGGIAHDFNNLLNVIIGNLQLADRAAGLDPRIGQNISGALRAALRGADLTRRLLAFARRQQLEPVVVDCNALIKGMHDLLDRSLPQNVELQCRLDPRLWPCRIDPVQLESALLNLAINARDALPDGGRIVIATDNEMLGGEDPRRPAALLPGEYVVISVQDNGLGMAPDTARRAFEPFFTTKEPGKGTGLGLPMVYGLLQQSGGLATLETQQGQGTTVRLFIPHAHCGNPA